MLNSVITEISINFLTEESFDAHINKALRTIGIFLDVSRAYLFLDSKDGKSTSNTHEWCALGVPSTIQISQNIPYSSFSLLNSKMKENAIFYCENINSLDENSKNHLAQQGIKSLLIVPIVTNKKRIGFIGIDECTRFRDWNSKDIEAMKLAAELIGKEYYKMKLEHKVNFLNKNDKLTKLYNRNFFFEQESCLEQEFFKEHKNFNIIILDIDYFKEINSKYGHAAGDFVLKEFGDMLKTMVRNHDFVARYDGNEFIIVSRIFEEDGSAALIKRIKNKIAKKVFLFDNKEIKVTFSCGVASSKEIDKEKFSLSSLVSLADDRLQEKKIKRT